MANQKKPDNRKTALVLGLIALVFFAGVFIKKIWFS